MRVSFEPSKMALLLVGIICALLAANVATFGLAAIFGFEELSAPLRLIRLDKEQNLPTFYSSVLLLSSSLLLMTIWYKAKLTQDSQRNYWLGLALIFMFLAIDEFVKIHEGLIEPVRELLGTSGALRFAWVIPYGIATALIGLIYSRFLWTLEPMVRWPIVFGGIVYVGGAIGMEMVGSYYVDSHGYAYDSKLVDTDMTYMLIASVEEVFEMLGLVIFLYALCIAIQRYVGTLQIDVIGQPAGAAGAVGGYGDRFGNIPDPR